MRLQESVRYLFSMPLSIKVGHNCLQGRTVLTAAQSYDCLSLSLVSDNRSSATIRMSYATEILVCAANILEFLIRDQHGRTASLN